MTLEELLTIELVYNNYIKKMELDFVKTKNTIQKEFEKVCVKYVGENRLYEDGHKFVDMFGNNKTINGCRMCKNMLGELLYDFEEGGALGESFVTKCLERCQ